MRSPTSDVVFDTPKPTRLVRRMLQIATSQSENDIGLDFFAGTGSTMDAVFRQNADDQSNRRCILVQLPEPLTQDASSSPATIADLTKDRLRQASEEVRSNNPTFTGDLGFRVFKLDSSNIRAWEPDGDDLEGTLLDSIDHIKPNRSQDDILYELLLKLGLDLCVPIETRTIAGKAVHSIGTRTLIACLDEHIDREEVDSLAFCIAEWHNQLESEGDTTVIFRDSAFEDDVAKTRRIWRPFWNSTD